MSKMKNGVFSRLDLLERPPWTAAPRAHVGIHSPLPQATSKVHVDAHGPPVAGICVTQMSLACARWPEAMLLSVGHAVTRCQVDVLGLSCCQGCSWPVLQQKAILC